MTTQKPPSTTCAFRLRKSPETSSKPLRPMFGTLGHQLAFKHLPRGSMGFQQASQVVIGDMPIARLDFGGESQRGWVRTELTGGLGCEWVQDWDAVQELEDLPSAQIRRLDIALTTWDGQVTHERVVKAHSQGRFFAAVGLQTSSKSPPAMTVRVEPAPSANAPLTSFLGPTRRASRWLERSAGV